MNSVASLWIGNSLGLIERASIQSFLKSGHRFVLYGYNPIDGVPDGVEFRSAQEVLPTSNIIRHKKSGSPALHSDLFRYALLAKTDHIWVDLDVIALRHFDFSSDWVFGLETPGEINGAVLKLPKDSLVLQDLLAFDEHTIGLPPMMKGFQKFRYLMKSFGRGFTIDQWPWGSIGPRALSYYLNRHGAFHHALPINAFYAIPLDQAHQFAVPGAITLDTLPKDAWAVHLWGKQLRTYIQDELDGQLPQECFLSECLQGRIP